MKRDIDSSRMKSTEDSFWNWAEKEGIFSLGSSWCSFTCASLVKSEQLTSSTCICWSCRWGCWCGDREQSGNFDGRSLVVTENFVGLGVKLAKHFGHWLNVFRSNCAIEFQHTEITKLHFNQIIDIDISNICMIFLRKNFVFKILHCKKKASKVNSMNCLLS